MGSGTFALIMISGYAGMFLVRDALITKPIRDTLTRYVPNLEHMFECAFCTGFWTSLVSAFVCGVTSVPVVIALGLSGAAACLFLDALFTLLERAVSVLSRLDVLLMKQQYATDDSADVEKVPY